MSKRLSSANGAGAALITAMTIAAIWGAWRAVLTVAAIQTVLIAFNIWVNLVYLPRRGLRAEGLRVAINTVGSVLVNHAAGWPEVGWLWLPFVALAFDHLDRRVARWNLVGICVTQDALALIDGVRWVEPLAFTLFAVFCSEISRLRFASIRDMLVFSDEQRARASDARAEIQRAHDRLEAETREKLRLEVELRQAQKLEAVGRLASGVAHEINTPVQYVGDSVAFLHEATRDLLGVVGKLQVVERSVLAGTPSADAAAEAEAAARDADLPYLLENVPKAFERVLDGLGRVATIVRSMKDFAHPDSREMTQVDLNRAIEATLTVARNEYKYVADLDAVYGDIPNVMCHCGDINQAVLNLVVNAAHAIGDVVQGTDAKGLIAVRTRRDGADVVVSISDTGAGIPDAVRERIFDPFFTTKEVGKGTGQGLAIVRSVVVEKHGGQLSFETEVGRGTTFHVRLPIEGRSGAIGAAA